MSDVAGTATDATDSVALCRAATPSEKPSTWNEGTVPLRREAERVQSEERDARLRLVIGRRRSPQRNRALITGH